MSTLTAAVKASGPIRSAGRMLLMPVNPTWFLVRHQNVPT
jgi:hypothetical protein